MLVHIKRENGKVFETKAYAYVHRGYHSEVFVLNEEREFECVKVFKEGTKYIIPQVMFINIHSFENGWIKEKNIEGYKQFIHNPKLLDRIRKGERNIFDEVTKVYLDSLDDSEEVNYGPIKIDDKDDIDNLMEFVGGFHDSHIVSIDADKKDELTLLLDGVWGIEKLYLHFKGNIRYKIASYYDEFWNYSCKIFKTKNQICFACCDDAETITVEELNNMDITYVVADEMYYSYEY